MIATQEFHNIILLYEMTGYDEGQLVAIDQDLVDVEDNPLILLEVRVDEIILIVLNVRANVMLH